MPEVWLPLRKVYEKGAKTIILIIPGASSMDRSELEDIIQWQEEKIEKEKPKPKAIIPSQDVKKMLLDYLKYLERKAKDSTKKFF